MAVSPAPRRLWLAQLAQTFVPVLSFVSNSFPSPSSRQDARRRSCNPGPGWRSHGRSQGCDGFTQPGWLARPPGDHLRDHGDSLWYCMYPNWKPLLLYYVGFLANLVLRVLTILAPVLTALLLGQNRRVLLHWVVLHDPTCTRGLLSSAYQHQVIVISRRRG